jgi:hypothetical protein
MSGSAPSLLQIGTRLLAPNSSRGGRDPHLIGRSAMTTLSGRFPTPIAEALTPTTRS